MVPTVRKILCATDLGRHARPGFAFAVSLARSYGARVELVHVLEPVGPYARGVLGLYVSDAAQEEHRAEARARIEEEIRQRVRRFCEIEGCRDPDGGDWVSAIRVLEGRPAEEILRHAKESGADLIVLGSHGHSAVEEIVLGSTAHRVLQKAVIPVLLVRCT